METVLSGIRPTGNLHLGNYYGAVTSFIKLQEAYKCLFFIADWHSLTTHPTPGDIQNSVRTILAEYLACGLDPEKATIYVQSDVPEVIELYLYLNMNAYLGELERVTSFKDKARKQPDNVNAGLLTYPSLMAADILIHKANKVPVGKDQEQNMEMARKFASSEKTSREQRPSCFVCSFFEKKEPKKLSPLFVKSGRLIDTVILPSPFGSEESGVGCRKPSKTI